MALSWYDQMMATLNSAQSQTDIDDPIADEIPDPERPPPNQDPDLPPPYTPPAPTPTTTDRLDAARRMRSFYDDGWFGGESPYDENMSVARSVMNQYPDGTALKDMFGPDPYSFFNAQRQSVGPSANYGPATMGGFQYGGYHPAGGYYQDDPQTIKPNDGNLPPGVNSPEALASYTNAVNKAYAFQNAYNGPALGSENLGSYGKGQTARYGRGALGNYGKNALGMRRNY